ncbi:DUF1735 domain-containing protein [Paraflavitalea speifideaquila]|uniref:DUF1735 domain-containing protein n=1 Tax=Paraflavitalea speifideaquila TaxID=3076558 RepID=UPI0028E85328|nr:DUF1735 domain-containing protein [Paraflavitalea speifideiaquila]
MKKYPFLFISTFVLCGLSSCLKDKDQLDPEGSQNTIEFLNVDIIASPTTSTYPLYNISYNIVPEADLALTVNYSGAHAAPQDIEVNIGIKAEALTTYNTENATTFTLLPANMYTMPVTKVIIPKGQKSAGFTIKFKTNLFDLTKKYAIPVSIQSSSYGIISGNFGTQLFAVVAKNKYDGIYTLRSRQGSVPDRTFTTTPYSWPYEISLITTGPSTVAMHNTGYANDYTHPLQSTASAWSRFGSYTPVFKFDGSDKLTDAANYYINPSNGRGGKINATITTSRYDAASKTIYAAILMTQPGFTDFPMYDTLVFKKAR